MVKFGMILIPNAITNIFSLAEMEKKYCITYNSSKEKAFVVDLPNKKLKFVQSKNGLFIRSEERRVGKECVP